MNDFVARDFNESDSLGVAGFEADRGACCDIQSETICSGSVEFELWICLDEMIMRTDLS